MNQKNKKCENCQKEISSGKYYTFAIIDKKNKKHLTYLYRMGILCPSCAEKEKQENFFYQEGMMK